MHFGCVILPEEYFSREGEQEAKRNRSIYFILEFKVKLQHFIKNKK